jgi:membrane-associated protease RseP (regulator of RpoE activity)
MSQLGGILIFVGAILVMVVVHEFGHFLAAKRFGMKVEEFFVGFGPRLFVYQKGETTYGLKAILIGGYVRIAGMNPWQTIPESELPRTYGAKPAWQRAILLSAGSATHLVLAIAILWAAFGVIGQSRVTTTLNEVAPEVQISPDDAVPSPAREAGLRAGDRILEADGRQIREWNEFQEVIRGHPGEAVAVVVSRSGVRREVTVTPVEVELQSARIGLIGVDPETVSDPQPVHVALWSATKTTGGLVVASVGLIPQIFSPSGIGRIFDSFGDEGERGLDQPVGLYGAGRFAGQAASGGRLEDLMFLLAGFVVIVGVFNMLPLPPLDGGHLLVLAIEKIRGKKVDMKKIVPVAVVVISFFLVLFVALLYLDIARPVQNPFE